MIKVKGEDNLADILTKLVTTVVLESLVFLGGLVFGVVSAVLCVARGRGRENEEGKRDPSICLLAAPSPRQAPQATTNHGGKPGGATKKLRAKDVAQHHSPSRGPHGRQIAEGGEDTSSNTENTRT